MQDATVAEPQKPLSVGLLAMSAIAGALIVVSFWQPILLLFDNWLNRPEYSHGLIIPLLAVYLVFQKRDTLLRKSFSGSWIGVGVVAVGSLIWFAGEMSTIYAVTQFALVVVIAGAILSLIGKHQFRHVAVPVAMLLLMIPLPAFIYNNFSSQLQLVSSELGVAMLRTLGVSVYLEGNVIDLGHFQMQVVEACDGLRYLFPLMTLGLIVGYFFRGPLWQRVFVFVSAVPITVLMNSTRIAMIGYFADHGNTALAEGILHDVQGWALFMMSVALLIFQVWLFVRLANSGIEWRTAFNFGDPVANKKTRSRPKQSVPAAFVAAVALLGATSAMAVALPNRAEMQPQREYCMTFPMMFDGYRGKRQSLEGIYIDALNVDDYLLADFSSNGGAPVNLFLAYYGSQRKGQSVHSPRSCLPGGGWKMQTFGAVPLASGDFGEKVNRAVIAKGDQRQLVYYWFKQRDRWLTSELSVKWFILFDALTRNRSDGALIRLVTPVSDGESLGEADIRLSDFAAQVRTELNRYVPD